MSNDENHVENDLAERDAAILNKYTGQLAKYTLVLAVATVITMASTIWIAWSTKELRNFAEQQALDAKTQIAATLAALKAADIQASAAKQANEISEAALLNSADSAKKQIRAYIVFERRREFVAPLQRNMHIRIIVKNVGTTPAYDVGLYSMFQFIDHPPKTDDVPDLFDFKRVFKSLRDDTANTGVLGPQINLTAEAATPKQISDSDLNAFKNGSKVLLIQAIVFYHDIYGEPHSTTLCDFAGVDKNDESGVGPGTQCFRLNKSD
jgi:hypothetical protein